MRVAFFLATLFAASVSAFASAASIVIPNHPQTFAHGEMLWNQLYLERAGGADHIQQFALRERRRTTPGLVVRLSFSGYQF